MNMEKEVQKLMYKTQALKESFSNKVADYEEKIADIRVDATMHIEEMNKRVDELEQENERLRNKLVEADGPVPEED